MRAALLLLALAFGCQKGPVIDSFSADRTSVEAGDVVTLSWVVRNADDVVIDPGGLVVTGQSSTQLTLLQTAPVTLTARKRAPFVGHVIARRSISIAVAPRALVPLFSARPSQVPPGARVTLSWKTSGDSVTIDSDAGSLGQQAAQGSLTVTPSATTLYTLRAHQSGSLQPAPIAVRVRVAQPPSVHLTADQLAVTAGQVVTLRWTGAGALGFGLDNGIGYLASATSLAVRPAQTTTYRVTAYGPAGGTATDAVTVAVSGPAPGTRALSYRDPTVPAGAVLALVQDPSSTPSLLVLRLVTTRAVAAGGLALTLPLDVTRAVLDASAAGDASPGFSVSVGAIDPGPPPLAAKAVLGAGLLAGSLVLGLAAKARSAGGTPDVQLAAGTELCRVRLVPAPSSQPGVVFPLAGAPARAVLTHLPRDPNALPSPIAVGTLTLL